jgi:hypothetical protein
MKYMLSTPDGFLSKPEARSIITALSNAEGCHLYVYNDEDQLILVHDLTQDLKSYIGGILLKHFEQDRTYSPGEGWKNRKGEELLDFAYKLDSCTGSHYLFKAWILKLTENLIRDAKGIPLIQEKVPYAE